MTPDEVMRIHRRHPDRTIPFCSLDPRFLTNTPEADFRPMPHHFKDAGFTGLPLTFHLAPDVVFLAHSQVFWAEIGTDVTEQTRDPEFGYRFMEEFQDRLYFGTGIANAVQELSIVSCFNTLRAERTVDPEILDRIEWKDAARLFGLSAEN